jgi:hypothetical protein
MTHMVQLWNYPCSMQGIVPHHYRFRSIEEKTDLEGKTNATHHKPRLLKYS